MTVALVVLACYMVGVVLRLGYLSKYDPADARLPPHGVMVLLLVMLATAWPLAVISDIDARITCYAYDIADRLRKDRRPEPPASEITGERRQFHVVDDSPKGTWVDE